MKGEGGPFWRKVPLPPSKPPPFPSQDFWLYRIPLVRSGEDLLFIFVRRIIGKGAYWSLSVFYCIGITCNLKKYSKVGALWERESGWKDGFLKSRIGF